MEVEHNLAAEARSWKCIYPLYINKVFARSRGRKIPSTKSVENPTLPEIAQVLTFLKIPFHLEDKKHPADFFEPGRARYRLKNEDNTLINPDVKSKMQLYLKLGEYIPKLKGRVKAQEAVLNEAANAGVRKKDKKNKKKR